MSGRNMAVELDSRMEIFADTSAFNARCKRKQTKTNENKQNYNF
jgi:hypothetical protein